MNGQVPSLSAYGLKGRDSLPPLSPGFISDTLGPFGTGISNSKLFFGCTFPWECAFLPNKLVNLKSPFSTLFSYYFTFDHETLLLPLPVLVPPPPAKKHRLSLGTRRAVGSVARLSNLVLGPNQRRFHGTESIVGGASRMRKMGGKRGDPLWSCSNLTKSCPESGPLHHVVESESQRKE